MFSPPGASKNDSSADMLNIRQRRSTVDFRRKRDTMQSEKEERKSIKSRKTFTSAESFNAGNKGSKNDTLIM